MRFLHFFGRAADSANGMGMAEKEHPGCEKDVPEAQGLRDMND